MSLKTRWPAVKREVLNRDKHVCQFCGGVATDVHHRKARGMGSTSRKDIYLGRANLISLCRACHDRVHRHPDWSASFGFTVRTGYAPEDMPVRTIEGLVSLTADGRRIKGEKL